MKKNLFLGILFISVLFPSFSQVLQINSDQWTATDGLNRELANISETGPSRSEKYIGMFYWTWHTDFHATFSPVMNITQILEQYPEAASDAGHPAWNGVTGGVFWWDEPLFGYYRTTDEWVLRKHAEMLADAGVDVVFFDCTNGTLTWRSSYTVLLKVWDQARKDGVKTPQIAFLLPFAANSNSLISLHEIYTDLYQPQLYKDLWFMWKDKPLVMAYPESLVAMKGNTAGLKFTATAPFYAINATCPSWGDNIGNITLKLYKWNADYATTISGTPVAEKTFINFRDNEKIRLTFDPLEAGEYIWELTNGTQQVGVWKWTDSVDPVISYYNGSKTTGNYESEISYNPEYSFTPLTNGTNHVPVEITVSIGQEVVNNMKEFFTFRPGQPDYVNGPSRNDHWGWLENYPQHGYVPKTEGGFEQATVGVAQNASDASGGHAAAFNNPLTYGRSYTKANGQDTRPEAYLKGLNFQEQWDRGLEIDPDLIYITGWNEWIAGRWFDWDVKPFAFVDQYSAEKSRDIEPAKSWGNKGDVYYMQLISNVRKFKGMQSQDTVSASKTIDISDIESWEGVLPEYHSYKGNTLHRDHPGQGSTLIYTNTTGRNDLVMAKVARDEAFVYFYIESAENLTDKSGPNWMRLFIDIDRNKSTGWEGYDFLINRISPADSAIVERSLNSWTWEKIGAAEYLIDGKSLVLKISRQVLGISDEQAVNFEFKWSDNMQDEGNIMDFYVNGDVAPGARFNYVYKADWSDDRYKFAEFPGNINQGLICESYGGTYDSIPLFYDQSITETRYPLSFELPATAEQNFGLRFNGFIDVPDKDSYTFYISTDLAARLYIGNTLVVKSEKSQEEQSGTIKLMPGKHSITVDYITTEANPKVLDIKISGSSIIKSPIPSTMLFKYNQPPTVALTFRENKKYFSPVDSVINVLVSDPDGSIEKIEIYDKNVLRVEEILPDLVIKNLEVGEHSIYARVWDNDGAVRESNILNFMVNPPFPIPGTIMAEEYMNGKNISLLSSTDSDGGKNARISYGWIEYPVQVTTDGVFQISFRVPASSGSKKINILANNVNVGTVDVGNTGNEQSWYDVSTDIYLTAGIQVLHLDILSIATIHRIEFNYLGTGTRPINAETPGEVTVIPNPSAVGFLIQSNYPLSSVEVFDLPGNMLEKISLEDNIFKSKVGENLPAGMYLLVVTGKDGSRKILKVLKI